MVLRILVISVVLAQTALAFDFGAPIYRQDGFGHFAFELIGETYNRRLDQSFRSLSSPVLSVDDLKGAAKNDFESFVGAARFSLLVHDRASLYANWGWLDQDAGDSLSPVYGGGVRVSLFENAITQTRLSVAASAHHAPSYDMTEEVILRRQIPGHISTDRTFTELKAGLVLSSITDLGSQQWLIPYGGVLGSFLRVSDESRIDIPELAATMEYDVESRERQWITALLGVSAHFGTTFSARIEGRMFGERSLSVGLRAAF